MRKARLRVFQGLVNYGTQAGLFAQGLREAGIDAISVSYPDAYKRLIDIELLHGGNTVQKIFRHSWNWIRRIYWFFRYNTFHFYYGTSLFPKQMDLPLYRFFGKKVIMEYLGYDVQLYQKSIDKYLITNVASYKPHEESIRADSSKIARLRHETKYVDLQLVCEPGYSEFVENSRVLPLAIDVSKIPFCPKNGQGEIIEIMHAPTHRGNKGTSFIQKAIDELLNDGYKINFTIVENVSHEELMERYKECDIFIDQVLGGWYGTAAIEAMAIGRPTICFLREEYYTYIDYGSKIPIINANPFSLYSELKSIINHRENLKEIGIQSRQFVEEVHNINNLVMQLLNLYHHLN
jgi:glycosyltransferase involved in cell wall biosynthesis